VLQALHYLHQQPGTLLHHDISPQNIMLTYDGHVQLIDFGIAKKAQHKSKTKEWLGKRVYWAPEYSNAHQYGIAAELYALALVVLELVQGEVLREPVEPEKLLQKLKAMALPQTLVDILHTALQPDPSKRFASADAMGKAIAQLLLEQGLTHVALQQQAQHFMRQLYPTSLSRQHTPLQPTQVLPKPASIPATFMRLSVTGLLMGAVMLLPTQKINDAKLAVKSSATVVASRTIGSGASADKPLLHRAGYLEVDSFPWSSVYLNGRFLGVTPLKEVAIPAGEYQLYLVTRDGRSLQMPVAIDANRRSKLFQKIP